MNSGRNDPCPCGSGKKYKHCCLTAANGPRNRAATPGAGRDGFDSSDLIRLFQSHQHAELERRLHELLPRFPESALLHGMMGGVLEMQGRDGLPFLERARSIAPGSFDANLNLGIALRTRGRLPEAVKAIAEALVLQPDNIAAQFNMAESMRLQGCFDKAEPMLRALVARHPGYAEALVSLADVLSELKAADEAERVCREAVRIAPGYVLAHFCLGNVLRRQGQLEAARGAYLQAIRVEPRYPTAHDALGSVLLEMGLPAEAEACYREALRLHPGAIETLLNLGQSYEQAGRIAEAENVYQEAVHLQPVNAVAQERLAYVLHQQGKVKEAVDCLHAVLAVNDRRWQARFTKALASVPVIAPTVDTSRQATQRFSAELDELSAWQEALDPPIIADEALAGISPPFLLAYRDGNHVAALSRFADIYCQFRLESPCPVQTEGTRVRLLIVSHHVYRHSVWDIVLRGLVQHLDRSRFEVVIYHLGTLEDEETTRARSWADIWRDRRSVVSPQGWLEAARIDCPDVVFYPELGMASLSYYLAAHRLAPLQVASWGHPVTSGLPTIDLYLSGDLIEPGDAETHYRERLVRLPGTGCCTEALPYSVEPLDDVLGGMLGDSGPRLVIAQRAIKFSPDDDPLFAEIAVRVPTAVFVLLRDPIAPWATDRVVDRLRKAFTARGADPHRQIVVLPWLSASQFLGLLDVCDVYLDCPSFSGYTTAWQAVHVGIPVVTWEGDFLRNRLAAGLLRKIGLPETIAHSCDEYVAIAVRLANESGQKGYQARRAAQKAAAGRADGDLTVVREFEHEILSSLRAIRGKPSQ